MNDDAQTFTGSATGPTPGSSAWRLHHERVATLLSKRLFFIIGSAKSGTTWLQKTLDGHPEISCRGEGHFPDFLAPLLSNAVSEYNRKSIHSNRLFGEGYEGYPCFEQEELRHLFTTAVALLMAKQSGDPAVRCIGEKTPENVRSIDLMAELFPEARFLHMIRDGRDVMVSAWFHHLRNDREGTLKEFPEFAAFLEAKTELWSVDVERALAFGARAPGRYREVRYEGLHRDLTAELRPLLSYLGVADGEALIEGCRASGAFKALSKGRDPGETDPTSHFRKGIVGDWSNHFDQRAKAVFEQRAGELLRGLGYRWE